MKKSKRVLAIIVCCILVIASCSVVYAGGIRLNKSKVQLYAGGKTTITAVGGNSKVTWTSSNSKIASVSSRGKRAVVTARKPGKAVITAKYGKKKLKCTVTVKKAKTVINKSTLKGTWEVDVPMTVKVNKTSIRWIYGSAFYYGNAMKFVLLGEDHGNWEETGKAPTKILRYMGNGMYERCAPELGRLYLSPDR